METPQISGQRPATHTRPFMDFAATAALLGGTLRIVSSWIDWAPGVGWLEALALVIDLALLFALVGIYMRSMDEVGTVGLVSFVATESGIASIVGPDTTAFGIDTYQAGVAVISIALALFGVVHIRRRTAFVRAAWLWIASTLTASLAMAVGAAGTGFLVGGILFGAGFVVAGLELRRPPA